MTLYVDPSAWLKRYVDEPDSERAVAMLGSDYDLVTGRHSIVEMRRSLGRLLDGRALAGARRDFHTDLEAFALVELDAITCDTAASIAEHTGSRTLDALHLACAQRVGGTSLPVLTFDVRQAQAARTLGMPVVGA